MSDQSAMGKVSRARGAAGEPSSEMRVRGEDTERHGQLALYRDCSSVGTGVLTHYLYRVASKEFLDKGLKVEVADEEEELADEEAKYSEGKRQGAEALNGGSW